MTKVVHAQTLFINSLLPQHNIYRLKKIFFFFGQSIYLNHEMYQMKGKHSFYPVIKLVASNFPEHWYICGIEESMGRFQSSQKPFNKFQMPIQGLRFQ